MPSFSQAELATKKKTTRREKFLPRMGALIPCVKLLAVIEPFSPKGQRGRPPIGLERMLRVYFLQQGYGLAGRVGIQFENHPHSENGWRKALDPFRRPVVKRP